MVLFYKTETVLLDIIFYNNAKSISCLILFKKIHIKSVRSYTLIKWMVGCLYHLTL